MIQTRPYTLILPLAAAVALAACGKHESAPATGEPAAASPAAAGPPATLENAVALAAYTPAEGIVDGGACALDAVNGAPAANATVDSSGDAMFSGWAGDAAGTVPAEAQLVLRGTQSYAAPLAFGGDRPDVAAALGNAALSTAGFNLPVRLAGVAPGTYEVLVASAGTPASRCTFNVSINVR